MIPSPTAEKILKTKLKYNDEDLIRINKFIRYLLSYNKKYNLISQSSENEIWTRHILDSAQLVKFIAFDDNLSLSDLGSGGGFPGIILSIFNKNPRFHVKLYEKSPIKVKFLENAIKLIGSNAKVIKGDIFGEIIDSRYIVCRAFKKIDKLIQVSREICKKPHKFIILKGKSAQEQLEKAMKNEIFKYSLEKSITSEDSKIVIWNR